ncbi:MAG: right-handed parallel beta-helix repeat-containing protein, partial [Candidatus Heimdallarchaeota archaeon]
DFLLLLLLILSLNNYFNQVSHPIYLDSSSHHSTEVNGLNNEVKGESQSELPPHQRVEDPTNWTYYFSDDFIDDDESNDKWTDISTHGVMRRGGGILNATSYGPTMDKHWHGPQWVHNFNTDIDDFELTLLPYCGNGLAESQGMLIVSLYSGDYATGLPVFSIIWADSWVDRAESYIELQEALGDTQTSGSTIMYNEWYTDDSNAFLTRGPAPEGKFLINDETDWLVTSGNATLVRSLSIHVCQALNRTVVPKLGVRSITFKGHSQVPVSPNLLQNGDFETGSFVSWDNTDFGGDEGSGRIQDNETFQGAYAAELSTSTARNRVGKYQYILLEPGQGWNLSFAMKYSGGSHYKAGLAVYYYEGESYIGHSYFYCTLMQPTSNSSSEALFNLTGDTLNQWGYFSFPLEVGSVFLPSDVQTTWASIDSVMVYLHNYGVEGYGGSMTVYYDALSIQKVLQIHDRPIFIDGNEDFISQASANNWPGNGTLAQPFVIDGLIITSSDFLIEIANTDVYFQLSDCILAESTIYGINLDNVKNGQIVNNSISNSSGEGISLRNSENCTLSGNIVTNTNSFGISLIQSWNCTLLNNSISSVYFAGIVL